MWRSAVQVCLGLQNGGLAQLARAPALQAGGQRFESVILHFKMQTLLIIIGKRAKKRLKDILKNSLNAEF